MLDDLRTHCATCVPLHPREQERLASVCGLCVPGAGSDAALDRIAARAAKVCGAPVGLVTFMGLDSQWFAGRCGSVLEGTERDESFCAHTILSDVPLVVESAATDPRFSHLKIVVGEPFVRFYAGAPIPDAAGLPLGAVCVLDVQPRPVNFRAVAALERMAVEVGVILETRRLVRELLGAEAGTEYGRVAQSRLESILAPLSPDPGPTVCT